MGHLGGRRHEGVKGFALTGRWEGMTSPTRRDLFRAAGTLGVAGTLGALGTAIDPVPAMAAASPKPGSAFVPADLSLHLLRRATYGPTPASHDLVRRKGRAAWLDDQLQPSRIDDSSCQHLIANRFPELSWSISEAWRKVPDSEHWSFMVSIATATIARAVWSKRQLFEVMCDFWSNHLNVTAPTDSVWFARHDYDRRVIRGHALGRFEDMLVASAKHPAMLNYLNNAESTKVEPNENYGRELLELHTLGVDAGYTEADMFQSTLIMTGFTVDVSTGLFKYDNYIHYTGPVKMMGFEDPNATGAGGQDVGVRYLKYLANHPATARHIASKLCVRFVSDDPDPTFVDALAQTYLDHGTAIAPVLRQLFLSQTFADSIGDKMRRPLEDIVATLRILDYGPETSGVTGLRSLYFVCNEVGHAPLAWALPDGYPDDTASWLSAGTTVNRWNRHLSLAAHWYPQELRQPDLRTLLPKNLPRTYGGMVDALAKRLVFRTLSNEHKQVVLALLERQSSDRFTAQDARETYRIAPAVAIILDSPYHGVR